MLRQPLARRLASRILLLMPYYRTTHYDSHRADIYDVRLKTVEPSGE
jgi:hypothetical protein